MYSLSNIKKVLILTIWLLFSGCSLLPLSKPSHVALENKINQLSKMLVDLNETIDLNEAQSLSRISVMYAQKLAHKYDVVSPPLWHNTLVNVGVKERGLCYEWSEDLLIKLFKKKYATLQFYTVGANIGGYFEHNALAVSAKKGNYRKSILLDAWRGSGDLYFIKLEKDKKYQWKNREKLYRSIKMKYHH